MMTIIIVVAIESDSNIIMQEQVCKMPCNDRVRTKQAT